MEEEEEEGGEEEEEGEEDDSGEGWRGMEEGWSMEHARMVSSSFERTEREEKIWERRVVRMGWKSFREGPRTVRRWRVFMRMGGRREEEEGVAMISESSFRTSFDSCWIDLGRRA